MTFRKLNKDLILEQIELDEINDHPTVLSHKEVIEPKNENNSLSIKVQRYIINIEKNLGFSLNDDDAIMKLNQLSEIIEIPNILYQYTA